MRYIIYILLIIGLVEALSSFAIAAIALAPQVYQDSYIERSQIFSVIAISGTMVITSLTLLVFIGQQLLLIQRKPSVIVCVALAVSGGTALVCALIGILAAPAETNKDFLFYFMHSSRFELSFIGFLAIASVAWALKSKTIGDTHKEQA